MAIIVRASGDAMDYAMYGDKSHMVAAYAQQQLDLMPRHESAYNHAMVEALQQSYKYLTDENIKYQTFESLRQAGVKLDGNFITELRTFEELQNAGLSMQRFVLADPFMRELYLGQNIDGYSNTYVNTTGKYVGEKDYNYQLMMSGVTIDNDDGTSVTRFYHAEEDLREGDRRLSHREKIALKHTCATARQIATELGFDFTNTAPVRTKINFE